MRHSLWLLVFVLLGSPASALTPTRSVILSTTITTIENPTTAEWAVAAPAGSTGLVGWKFRSVFNGTAAYLTVQIFSEGALIETTELFNDYRDNDPARTQAQSGRGWPLPIEVYAYCFGSPGAVCTPVLILDFE